VASFFWNTVYMYCVSVLYENGLSYPHRTWYRYILYGSGSVRIDLEVKRSRLQGYENRDGCMAASGCCGHYAGVGLHVVWQL